LAGPVEDRARIQWKCVFGSRSGNSWGDGGSTDRANRKAANVTDSFPFAILQ
jgi:hypothetical protein